MSQPFERSCRFCPLFVNEEHSKEQASKEGQGRPSHPPCLFRRGCLASRQIRSEWLGHRAIKIFVPREPEVQDMVQLLETALVDQRFDHFMMVGQRTIRCTLRHCSARCTKGSSYTGRWGSSDTTCQGTAMSRALDQWQLSGGSLNRWVQTFAHRDPYANLLLELTEPEIEEWWRNAICPSENKT